MTPHRIQLFLLAAALATACVPRDRYDNAVADAKTAKDAATQCAADRDKANAEVARLNDALKELQALADQREKAQAAADQRAQLFKQLAMKFHKMIDSGQLKVRLRDGRMVIELANDVLFDSGQTSIKPEGQK